jgi:hypothetical protein
MWGLCILHQAEPALPGDTESIDSLINPTAVRPEALAVLNILLRDATAMRQRLFSYLQFYLTVQSGLAVFFGFLTHESLEAQRTCW